MNDLIGNISKTPATDKIAQVKGVADKIRALIATEKVPTAASAKPSDIVIPGKPVLIPKSPAVANAPPPKLSKAVPMPPAAPQPVRQHRAEAPANWKTRAAARAAARNARK